MIKALVVREGDKNTPLFHVFTLNRRKKNIITSIKTTSGEFSNDEKEIVRTFNQYFNSIFLSTNPISIDQELILIVKPISNEENEQLKAIPSVDEINETLFSMGPLKTLRLDEIPTMF